MKKQPHPVGIDLRPVGIDPLVDFAFKKVLGSPEHEKVTIHFLNAILGGEAKITHVTFPDTEIGKAREAVVGWVKVPLSRSFLGLFFSLFCC